ncbi:MAG: hypothetical protein HKN29_03270 [Rhodothermales bacterium]|nr:hypothetical protein [Rhodothermales bacterium]
MCDPQRLWIALVVAMAITTGCQPFSPVYSPAAERELTLLKGRTLRLMALAEEPFADQTKAVARLRGDLGSARDRAAARPRNGLTLRQWNELMATDGHLLGGFLFRWETDTTLAAGFIIEARLLVERAMEVMIEHEKAKVGGAS